MERHCEPPACGRRFYQTPKTPMVQISTDNLGLPHLFCEKTEKNAIIDVLGQDFLINVSEAVRQKLLV